MNEINKLIVESPLKGDWVTPHTPGDRIPSHGTEVLGQKYAYDFIQIDKHSKHKLKFYNSSIFKYWTIGVPIKDCYSYREPIVSPVNGKVIIAKDGVKEPRRLHPIFDEFKVFLRTALISLKAVFISAEKIPLHKFIGNYVIIEFDNNYAFFAHISTATIKVKEGDTVKVGEIIGEVGHTGNSTAPHLHFQIMDSSELLDANGILCGFNRYHVLENDQWEEVRQGIPKSDQLLRL